MKIVGLKELHELTGAIVRGVRDRGEEMVIHDRGLPVAKLVPYGANPQPTWDEILAPVWAAAQAARRQGDQVRENPVVAERKRRAHADRLR